MASNKSQTILNKGKKACPFCGKQAFGALGNDEWSSKILCDPTLRVSDHEERHMLCPEGHHWTDRRKVEQFVGLLGEAP